VVVLVPTAIAEGILREELAGRPVVVGLGAALVCTLWFRRTHPWRAFLVAFGVAHVVTLIELVGDVEPAALYTSAVILLLPYSLFRWGAGREAALGLVLMLTAFGLSALNGEMRGVADAVGGAVVLLFPAALGASVRFRANAQRRELEHVKLREREQLARELHDTVAHHVSAIAIQAQAGRAVAATRPDAALDALEVIEEEAARTLAELRTMVGALRDDEAAELAPQAGVGDIDRLARSASSEHPVEIELSGDLDDLRPSVGATIYRLAQESITNAIRHARNASRIRVRVVGDDDVVRLTVTDDGEPPSRATSTSGFGLVGMAERAALLGGTLKAGPSDDGGWTVEAVLPRDGGAR
jgi:signal transduction histidine kinase